MMAPTVERKSEYTLPENTCMPPIAGTIQWCSSASMQAKVRSPTLKSNGQGEKPRVISESSQRRNILRLEIRIPTPFSHAESMREMAHSTHPEFSRLFLPPYA